MKRHIYVQQLEARNFAKNGENFKREFCLNFIILFPILPVVLSLHVSKTFSEENQNGGGGGGGGINSRYGGTA